MKVILQGDGRVVLLRIILRNLISANDLAKILNVLRYADHAKLFQLGVYVLPFKLGQLAGCGLRQQVQELELRVHLLMNLRMRHRLDKRLVRPQSERALPAVALVVHVRQREHLLIELVHRRQLEVLLRIALLSAWIIGSLIHVIHIVHWLTIHGLRINNNCECPFPI